VKRTTAMLALALGAFALSPTALADDESTEASTTFEGTCQFSGKLRQRPALTNTPQAGEGVARAAGACFGTLTDERGHVRRLDGERVKYFASARGTLSCAGGTAAGSGFLDFRGERLCFRFSEVRGPGVGAIRLDGAAGGSAAGEARVSQDEDPLEIVRKCGGEGLRQVGIDIDLATTPTISG
jgi:hypothetical protein